MPTQWILLMRGEVSVTINKFLTYAGVFFGRMLMALPNTAKSQLRMPLIG
jgi:hypothetical protein